MTHPAQSVVTTRTSEVNGAMSKTCPTCGTLNPDEANVCFNCGTSVAGYPTSPNDPASTTSPKTFNQPSYPNPPQNLGGYPYPPSVPPQYQPPYPAQPMAPPQYQGQPFQYGQYPPQPMPMMYAQPPMMVPVYPVIPKSRAAFVLLGIFLGPFGIHNFYAGFAGRGIVQLLLTLLTCGYGAFIAWFWMIVEIIVVDRDSNGVPMN
jgi:TM2 domain-containing membrane protein YozV